MEVGVFWGCDRIWSRGNIGRGRRGNGGRREGGRKRFKRKKREVFLAEARKEINV